MIELQAHEFSRILPLLAGIKQKVLPYAICEGINPGRVFVDRHDNPLTALIWTTVGYFFLAGEPAQVRDKTAIRQVLTDIFIPIQQASGENGFLLITSTEAWKEHLPSLLPRRQVIEIYRRTFAFDLTRFSARGDWRAKTPPGFCLRTINAEQASQVGALAGWSSFHHFSMNGIGYVLLDGDKIASTCTSVFSSSEMIEIDVHTAENYQRRGFALLTASALIEECLRRGKKPNWECFWDNEPSTMLAKKLGFNPLEDYPVYYWEENRDKETNNGAEIETT